MTLKRGLSLIVVAFVLGLVGCMTTLPTVTLSGPAGPYPVGTPVTLTATGNPGSSSGLWTYSFSASPACGTFNPATIGPTNQTTVTTQFTGTTATSNCVLTVTLTTASGKTATASITRDVIVPASALPACSLPALTGQVVPAGGVNNHPTDGAAGDRLFAYVEPEAGSPTTDSVLHLGSPLASRSTCPGPGDVECDDDDGPGLSSVIAGHPWSSGYAWSVNPYSATLALNYTLYRHTAPATSLVDMEASGDVPGNAAGAVSVPATAPWIIAAEISPSGDQDWFKFFASAGQKIWIVMDGSPNSRLAPHDDDSSSLDGVIELRTDTGALIWSNDGGFGSPQPNAETRTHTITTSGVYIIVVRGYGTETHAYHLVACVVP